MEHTLRLRPDGRHHLGMVGAHVEGADAAREIDVAVAIDVHEGGAPGRGDEDGVLLVDAAGNVLLAEPCELSRPRAWHLGHDGDRPLPQCTSGRRKVGPAAVSARTSPWRAPLTAAARMPFPGAEPGHRPGCPERDSAIRSPLNDERTFPQHVGGSGGGWTAEGRQAEGAARRLIIHDGRS